MIKIQSSNVRYDYKIYHYSQIRQYATHVDLSMLTNTTTMTKISHKI